MEHHFNPNPLGPNLQQAGGVCTQILQKVCPSPFYMCNKKLGNVLGQCHDLSLGLVTKVKTNGKQDKRNGPKYGVKAVVGL
jgi:hypothetical protein